MRTLISIFVFLCSSCHCAAQATNKHDGLSIVALDINSSIFYYGEPIYFYFKAVNMTEDIKSYHKPSNVTNYSLHLTNLTTGEVEESRQWLSHPRGAQLGSVPSGDRAYRPKEKFIIKGLLNPLFADRKLNEQIVFSYNLANKLLAIEKGEYRLTIEYQLLPSDRIISTSFDFEIKAIPADQEQAFEQYVRSTTYAGHSYRRGGGGSYSATHPDSYENFLKKYPNSSYSDYAFVDMVNQVYIYPDQGKEASIEKFNQYLNYFPNIEQSSLKMEYITHLPFCVNAMPGDNLRVELDRFLRDELSDEDIDLSTVLINVAKGMYQVEGLRNYARTTIR